MGKERSIIINFFIIIILCACKSEINSNAMMNKNGNITIVNTKKVNTTTGLESLNKFDSIKYTNYEYCPLEEEKDKNITFKKIKLFKNDSVFKGVISYNENVKIDSIYFLAYVARGENKVVCFRGIPRFIKEDEVFIYSFQVLDDYNNCDDGLNNKNVIEDKRYKVDSNGFFIKIKTKNFKEHKLIGGN
jgi:hypothetical protein